MCYIDIEGRPLLHVHFRAGPMRQNSCLMGNSCVGIGYTTDARQEMVVDVACQSRLSARLTGDATYHFLPGIRGVTNPYTLVSHQATITKNTCINHIYQSKNIKIA